MAVRTELGIILINGKSKKKNNWLDYLNTMEEITLDKQAYIYKPKGNHSLGRPKKILSDDTLGAGTDKKS